MYKIGVIGKRDEILCYMAAGFVIYPASNAEEANKMIETAKNDNCRIIFITPGLAQEVQNDKVIPLPDGASNYGFERMSRVVAKAVGSDIIYKEKR